jgi:hypothetical protein
MSRQTQRRRCYFDYIQHSPWYSPFIDVFVANQYHWNYKFREAKICCPFSIILISDTQTHCPITIFAMDYRNKPATEDANGAESLLNLLHKWHTVEVIHGPTDLKVEAVN